MLYVVTNKGLKILSSRVKGLLTEPLNIGWGTGSTAPAIGDTALVAEDITGGYARVAGVSSIVTLGTVDDTYQVSGTLTAIAVLNITEWGLFDTAGNLLCRAVEATGYPLSIGGSLNFVFKVQMSRCP